MAIKFENKESVVATAAFNPITNNVIITQSNGNTMIDSPQVIIVSWKVFKEIMREMTKEKKLAEQS